MDVNLKTAIAAIATAGLVVAGIAVITYIHVKQQPTPTPTPTLTEPQFIKDPITKCQYISANGAMYPRLDDRRVHICSDLPKYSFNPNPEG